MVVVYLYLRGLRKQNPLLERVREVREEKGEDRKREKKRNEERRERSDEEYEEMEEEDEEEERERESKGLGGKKKKTLVCNILQLEMTDQK